MTYNELAGTSLVHDTARTLLRGTREFCLQLHQLYFSYVTCFFFLQAMVSSKRKLEDRENEVCLASIAFVFTASLVWAMMRKLPALLHGV